MTEIRPPDDDQPEVPNELKTQIPSSADAPTVTQGSNAAEGMEPVFEVPLPPAVVQVQEPPIQQGEEIEQSDESQAMPYIPPVQSGPQPTYIPSDEAIQESEEGNESEEEQAQLANTPKEGAAPEEEEEGKKKGCCSCCMGCMCLTAMCTAVCACMRGCCRCCCAPSRPVGPSRPIYPVPRRPYGPGRRRRW